MAQVVLSGLGGAIGGGIGRILGGVVGGALDRRLVAGLGPARQGPRLETLRIQSSAEGAPMACVFGRARVTGQIIWAARFLEDRHKSGGGKGGPGTVDYAYSLSFAVALCEGPIDGIGRVWADGQPLDLSGVMMRVHRGEADQTPDALIEAIEGAAPAYRGAAYVVFEDLALGAFGNRPPQLSFEVFQRPRGAGLALEDRIEGVCLIPGAGEFALATQAVLRREGLTRTTAENVHASGGQADLLISLDQLQAQCPNLKRVSLVIGWFGDDLRAGHCRIRPGVDRRDKPTEPLSWSVAGVERTEAYVVSQVDDGPAYGGTPSDDSVRQAVVELKARGLEVTLYPFVFMDIAADNDLPDPYGGSRQAAYPWRGRIRGEDGVEAEGQIAALFGSADGWGLRRLALHYAGLAAETGADGLLIGSEMRGVTWTRDAGGAYPAVAQYRALAAECRAIVGTGVSLAYAADWSEYFGHQPGDGEVRFHLDPLWADEAIDYVGIDWYPPLGDWRAGDGGLDAAVFAGPDDPAYLDCQTVGGEGFDWYYADDADRAAQVRTLIADTAHGEDWVFRPKDLIGWWSNAHHERLGGVRQSTPTAWQGGMKPIRLTEFGCAAVDRGGNAPNLFQDPKSAESALPPFSTGARDDGMQRRAVEAVLRRFALQENNPVSPIYGGPMLEGADVWCWDARPYPAFPGRSDVWADAGAWRAGHWLNGRLAGDGADLLAAVLKRGGLSEDAFVIGQPVGAVQGYVIDRPMRTRDALDPLLTAFDMVGAERDGRIALVGPEPVATALDIERLALGDQGWPWVAERTLALKPGEARVRFIDETNAYQTGAAVERSDGEGGGVDLDLPAVCGQGLAQAAAARILADHEGERLTIQLGPLEALKLESGDRLDVEGRSGTWRVERLSWDETPTARLAPVTDIAPSDDVQSVRAPTMPMVFGAPLLRLLDLAPLPGQEEDVRPLAAVAADPWRSVTVHVGPSPTGLTPRGQVERPATVGALVEPLVAGVVNRWDEINVITVRVEGAAPIGRDAAGVLGGANALAVETPVGWEIVQFRSAQLVGGGVWRLSGLLRAQQGTEAEMHAGAGAGAVVVMLDEALARLDIKTVERRLTLIARAAPIGAPAGGEGVSEIAVMIEGRAARPWSPAHLSVEIGEDGLSLKWIPRVRVNGDVWEGEPTAVDPERYRVRVLDGSETVRSWETAMREAAYLTTEQVEDFPSGVGPDVRIAVAQGNDAFGWGVEAKVAIPL